MDTDGDTGGDTMAARRRGENFPVAGLLTPAALRPAVLALYRFARIADDIADNMADNMADGPARGAVERLAVLDAMKAAVAGRPALAPPGASEAVAAAAALRGALVARAVDVAPASAFLYALGVETTLSRLPDAEALLTVSRMTAAPIGRLVVALHGASDDPVLRDAGAALATALQLLDHIQDCGDDYRRLDRVYLPLDWLGEAGIGPDGLASPRLDRRLRRVLDRCLDLADAELAAAAPLLAARGRRRLALVAGATLALASALSRRLRRGDVLAGRVGLGLWGRLAALTIWARQAAQARRSRRNGPARRQK